MSGLAQMYDLKDEKQAQEYLNTLGTEYRFQCFHEKLPDGCHRLADYLEAFKHELERARKIYHANCDDSKYGHSCFKYANYNMVGRAGETNMQEASAYYAKGCEYGYAPSCHNAALLHDTGKLEEDTKNRDYVTAASYLEKGCEMSNVPSCHLLSTYYITGKKGVAKDMKKAFTLAQKACDGGHMYACVNLSQMYARGDGVEKNKEMANKVKAKAQELYKDVSEVRQTLKFSE